MLRNLFRAMLSGQTIELIYYDRKGKLTQRKIKILSIDHDKIKAYCYFRKGPRYFIIERILAIAILHHNVG